jgi:hypothetical protein
MQVFEQKVDNSIVENCVVSYNWTVDSGQNKEEELVIGTHHDTSVLN